jgi:hypothetical protein
MRNSNHAGPNLGFHQGSGVRKNVRNYIHARKNQGFRQILD